MNRRVFLMGSLGAVAGGGAAHGHSTEKPLRIGVIGTANRAQSNIDGVAHENIVAVCDTDRNYLAKSKARFTDARAYTDFRKMIEDGGLDAVVVSTPDHTHAPATLWALAAGLHVYCEKPLTHTVEEARQVAQAAAKSGKATQMGTQIHASSNYRRVVEVIRSGAIGPVHEVHTWVRKVWSGAPLGDAQGAVPDHVDWENWLGPTPTRGYQPELLPAKWRGYWAYGNGTLGDMGCHHLDLPFWALDLRHPESVRASGPPVDPIRTPEQLTVEYRFGARGSQPPVKVVWSDGDRLPFILKEIDAPQWSAGNLFVGEKGCLLADYSRWMLLPDTDEINFRNYKPPAPSIPESIGHYREWLRACRTGEPTTCHFGYAGALTETVLLGSVAYRSGKALTWDPVGMRSVGAPGADRYLREEWRPGWTR